MLYNSAVTGEPAAALFLCLKWLLGSVSLGCESDVDCGIAYFGI